MQDVMICFIIFGSITAIVSMKHRHKMEEMRILRGEGGKNVAGDDLRKLQEQIHELRDTTTRYDMSFDAALQRLEARVSHIESQQRQASPQVDTIGTMSGS
jgi:hypothetical protein